MRPERRRLDPAHIVPIVADGAIWLRAEVEGMAVPLVILDTTSRPELAEFVRMHTVVASGDVVVEWGVLDEDRIGLVLHLVRPIETEAVIVFEVSKRGIVIDAALRAGAIYIQAGRPGDRVASTPDAPRVLVQIGGTGFEERWDALFNQGISTAMMRKGLNRKDAKAAAAQTIELLRNTFGQRLS